LENTACNSAEYQSAGFAFLFLFLFLFFIALGFVSVELRHALQWYWSAASGPGGSR
jgi:hypothetical protein